MSCVFHVRSGDGSPLTGLGAAQRAQAVEPRIGMASPQNASIDDGKTKQEGRCAIRRRRGFVERPRMRSRSAQGATRRQTEWATMPLVEALAGTA